MTDAERISLFTACSPWEPLDALIPRLAAWGIRGLDLAVRPMAWDAAKPPNCWSNNAAAIAPDLPLAQAARLRRLMETHGIACVGVCGYAPIADGATAAQLFALACELGAPWVRLQPERPKPGHAVAQVERARRDLDARCAEAARLGLAVVLETHDWTLAASVSGTLRLIEHIDPRHAGIILDVGNLAREGHEQLAFAVDLASPRLRHVQIKDVAPRRDSAAWCGQAWDLADLGQGIIDWPKAAGLIRATGYAGWWSIENFVALERGPARLGDDAQFVRKILA